MTTRDLNIAAQIANPWGSANLSAFAPGEIETAAKILTGQKVPLLALKEKCGELADEAPLGAYVAADQDKFRKLREEFERVRLSFLVDDIKTVFLKSTGLYPSFHYVSSNLDVLIPADRSRAARQRLVELGYVELVNVEEPQKYLFRRFDGSGFSYTFHMHEQVGWGVPFVDNETMWRNTRAAADDPDIKIPGPEEALLVTLAHWFYEDKSLSLGNLMATAHAVKNLGEALEVPSAAAERRGWAEGYWAALSVFDTAWERLYGERFLDEPQQASLADGLEKHPMISGNLLPRVFYDGEEPAIIPFMLNKWFYYRKIINDPSRSFSTKIADVAATLLWAVRWKLHIRSQKPALITVSGCDGSGKTLQAQGLKDAFDTCDVRAKVVWARGASSRFMGAFIGAAKKAHGLLAGSKETGSGGKTADEVTDDKKMAYRRRALKNPFLRFLFSVLYASDLSWTYCFKVRLLKLMGYVVITDRYVYDGLVDFALISGGSVERPPRALRWLLRSAPRPDVAVILDVEPAEALRRKPEEGSTGHLQDARRAFEKLAAAENLELIRVGQTPETIREALVRDCLTVFYKKYKTFINWLLRSNPNQLNPPRTTV